MKRMSIFISPITLCILLSITSAVVNPAEAEGKSGVTTSSLSTTIRNLIEKNNNNQSVKNTSTNIKNKLDNIFKKEKNAVPSGILNKDVKEKLSDIFQNNTFKDISKKKDSTIKDNSPSDQNTALTDKLKELKDKFKIPENTATNLKDILNKSPLKAIPNQNNSSFTTSQEENYPGREYRTRESNPEDSLAEYIPAELIVKFKKEAKIGAVADKLLERGQSFQSITNSSNLDNLNKKYKLTRIKRLFADSGQGNPPSGTISTATVGRLHQDMKNRFTEKINAVKTRFSQRSKRIPQGITIPYLEEVYLFTLAKGSDVLTAAQEYSQDTNVEYAQPNYLCKTQMVPNDPFYHSQGSWGQDYDDLWGLKPDKLNCEAAWEISQGDGVVVAVIDTGIDYNHEDLTDNVWINKGEIPSNGIDDDNNGSIDDVYGYDFDNGDNNPFDDHGHGTHCAGTIAAAGNNNTGIIGVAPQAKVMALKGLDNTGSGSLSNLIQATKYAADNGADILSNSWGMVVYVPEGVPVLEDAFDYAYALGCVNIAAAGNDASDVANFFPAKLDNVLAVAATDPNDRRTPFSNFGTLIDVAAPGGGTGNMSNTPSGKHYYVNILSARANGTDMYKEAPNYTPGEFVIDNNYYRAQGTSMACPHVAGTAALVASLHPEFSNQEIDVVIKTGVDDVALDKCPNAGRINAQKCMEIQSPCIAKIISPKYSLFLKEDIDIVGTASGDSFVSYELEYKEEAEETWHTFANSYSPVENGFLGRLKATELPEGNYFLKLTVENNNSIEFSDLTFVYVMYTLKSNWPFLYYDHSIFPEGASPTLADIDQDGKDEIIIAHTHYYFNEAGKAITSVLVYAFNGDATFVEGWPVELFDGGWNTESSPAVADIDADGELEIAVFTQNKVYVLERDGKTADGWPKQGWPKKNGEIPREFSINANAVVKDIDADKDGDMEIICATDTITEEKNNQLLIWHPDGTSALSQPVEGLNYRSATPAVGDIDNDGKMEIVTVTNTWEHPRLTEVCAYKYQADGTLLREWKREITNSISFGNAAISLANLDNDSNGYLEVLLTMYRDENNENSKGHIFVFTHDGNDSPGWPKPESIPPNPWTLPVPGDVDNDGDLEIVVFGSDRQKDFANEISVWHHNGTLAWKWSVEKSFYAAPILLDIDNDQDLEIIGGTVDGNIFAWHHNGDTLWQKRIPSTISSTPAVGDLDGDGINELVINAGDTGDDIRGVFVWEIGQCSSLVWPMLQHDPQHTGCYSTGGATPPPSTTNHPPTAYGQSVTTKENTSLEITLNANDPNGDVLTYSVVDFPGHGYLSNIKSKITTYTSDQDYSGTDSFSFKVNDGKADSNIATVNITVTSDTPPPATNNPPQTFDQSVTTEKNTPLEITLNANDPNSDVLTYSVVDFPGHGYLSNIKSKITTYTPNQDYSGTDSFSFKANDGKADSNTARVNIVIHDIGEKNDDDDNNKDTDNGNNNDNDQSFKNRFKGLLDWIKKIKR